MPVFNSNNTEWLDGNYSLFLGQQPALYDSINVKYPKIFDLYKLQVSQRWTENEFNHEQSRLDLLNCPKSIYQTMLLNLSFQWELDSVASRSIAPLLAPFITNSEFWAAIMENSNMEVVHALSYSEAVRQCVPNTREVFEMVMLNKKTLKRAEKVIQVFNDLAEVGAEYMLGIRKNDQTTYNFVFIGLATLYILERLQFMSSFAATFAIVEQGYFQSFGKFIQKIMLDEIACHAALDMEAIRIEMQTPRGKLAMQEVGHVILGILNEIRQSEHNWGPYLFSEGRAIVGLNAELLGDWVDQNSQPIYDLFGFDLPFDRITKTSLPWMLNWIDIDKFQNTNQESDNNNYALNVVKNDLGDDELEM